VEYVGDGHEQIAHRPKVHCESSKFKMVFITFSYPLFVSLLSPSFILLSTKYHRALAFARIENHFFVNEGFMEDGKLITDAHKIKHLPIIIIQGRYDVVCPAKTSWDLYHALGGKANPNIKYTIIDAAGHSGHEKDIEEALVDAANDFKKIKF
jgi:proline iminopeptidase